MITASMRTEELLEELKGSNVELEKRTNELEEKASLLEEKNREIAQASASLEEKAKQLALVSKYKSEFLANMSHELRTPLNSLLILAKLLSDNDENSLTPKQVEYAKTIHSAGNDLLGLINQILDLSKIEAGKLQIETKRVALGEVRDFVEGNFRQVAEQKGLDFTVHLSPEVPPALNTDAQRLQQILKNLLSNAFKFTEKGRVELADRGGPRRGLLQDRGAAQGQLGARLLGDRHRHRHPRGQAAADLRGVPAGRRLDQPHVRRHRPRPDHQPRAGPPARRRAGGAQRAGHGQHLHAVPAARPSPRLRGGVHRDGRRAAMPRHPRAGAAAGRPSCWRSSQGRKVLLIDDDTRNLFAVTSLLERAEDEGGRRQHGAGGPRRPEEQSGPRSRADGHHVAGHGRLPGHPPDPGHARTTCGCPSSR